MRHSLSLSTYSARFGAVLTRLSQRLWARYELGRQRAALRALSDRALKDIGVSRADAEAEGCRGIWGEATPIPRRRHS